MKVTDLVLMSLEETKVYVEGALKGLTQEDLAWTPKPHSNSIAFLMWHLARVEDIWINRLIQGNQDCYEKDGWYKKFGTPAEDSGMGYDVAKLKAWPVPKLELLKEYAAAMRKNTISFVKSLSEKQLEEVKDYHFFKNTVGWALSHLVTEVGEHSGQIGYLKGMMKGIEIMPVPPKQ
ncbi:MAG: DinB family protein [Dehalococcoidales bacterium]